MRVAKLVDHAKRQERWARRLRSLDEFACAYGEFISKLARWDWFLNPISFRDNSSNAGPPVQDAAMKAIKGWLADIQKQAGSPIGWMLGEEFGKLGGRYHCHGLVTGVGHLHRRFWWQEAFRRFGRTRIEPFDPDRAAAFYASKYAAKELGAIHFGGTLAGIDLSQPYESTSHCGKKSGMRSAELPKDFFRLSMKRWHR